MTTFPQKVITFPPKVTFHPQLVKNFSKIIFYPKICWFTHFRCQNVVSRICALFSSNPPECQDWGAGGSSPGVKPILAMPGFERFLYSHSSTVKKTPLRLKPFEKSWVCSACLVTEKKATRVDTFSVQGFLLPFLKFQCPQVVFFVPHCCRFQIITIVHQHLRGEAFTKE